MRDAQELANLLVRALRTIVEVLARPLGDPYRQFKGVMKVLKVGDKLGRVHVVPVQDKEVDRAVVAAPVEEFE